ncbi:MAG: ABC transporter substrate-binding protein [Verrucomicrobiaceae bacterium]|nr:ABC transporter substrate-binding protein [Verrucomicrobiaceae bacterium]
MKSNAKARKSQFPSTATPVVRIGFVPLADAAPLIVADQLGMFDAHGVRVELQRQVGWATIREKILYREIDAAHAPAGLALSLRLGVHGQNCRSLAPFVMNLNGNAITLSRDLFERGVRDARSLLKLIRSTPQHLYTFGIVADLSSHQILLRLWMESGGINPDRDVRIVTLPPTQMAGSLSAGLLDGYCVGEPWNSAAIVSGTGWCPATSETIAPGHPEKVLLTTEDFAENRPVEFAAILRALRDACEYCDNPKNRKRLTSVMAPAFRHHDDHNLLSLSYVGPFQCGIEQREAGSFHVFHRQEANRPSIRRGRWLTENLHRYRILQNRSLAELQEAMAACWSGDHYDQAMSQSSLVSPTRTPKSALI